NENRYCKATDTSLSQSNNRLPRQMLRNRTLLSYSRAKGLFSDTRVAGSRRRAGRHLGKEDSVFDRVHGIELCNEGVSNLRTRAQYSREVRKARFPSYWCRCRGGSRDEDRLSRLHCQLACSECISDLHADLADYPKSFR